MRERGFTLLELMVTVGILAIIAGIAAPSFSNLVRANQVVSSANELVALLQVARSNAITNRATVTVCPSADGTSCSATLGTRWIAFYTKGATTTVVRDSTLSDSVAVKTSANLSGASNKFSFTADGFSKVGANTTGTVGVCIGRLSGMNSTDVTASIGRISTARRAATSNCTAPGDN